MSAEYVPIEGIDHQAQLEVIQHKWFKVAVNFREAGLALRDPSRSNTAEWLERRIDALEQSDALLDAHSLFLGKIAVGGEL